MAALNVSETRLIHAHEERIRDTDSMRYESDEASECHELQALLKFHDKRDGHVSISIFHYSFLVYYESAFFGFLPVPHYPMM